MSSENTLSLKNLNRQLSRHPLARKGFQQTLTALSWLAPNHVVSLIEKQVNVPRSWPLRERQQNYLNSLQHIEFVFNGKKISAWSTGEAPQVLFVHGWSGRGVQFQNLSEELKRNNISSLLLDLPAHGESEGRETHLFEVAKVLGDIINQVPTLNTIIAHSFGAAATAFYLRHHDTNEQIKKLIFLAPLTNVKHGFKHTALSSGIPKNLLDLIFLRAEERHSFCWENLTPSALSPSKPRPLLIFHDLQDPDLGVEHSTQLQLHWPGAKLILTQNLGHIRILRDANVIQKIGMFLQDQTEFDLKVENF